MVHVYYTLVGNIIICSMCRVYSRCVSNMKSLMQYLIVIYITKSDSRINCFALGKFSIRMSWRHPKQWRSIGEKQLAYCVVLARWTTWPWPCSVLSASKLMRGSWCQWMWLWFEEFNHSPTDIVKWDFSSARTRYLYYTMKGNLAMLCWFCL